MTGTQEHQTCIKGKNVRLNRKYLSDGHCAQDVEEDKRAVGVIFAQQITVRQSLDVRQWYER